VFIFKEHLQLGPAALPIEVAALAALVAGVITLSHSRLVQGDTPEDEAALRPVASALDVGDVAG
jgi:hypothetical protein